ncbi:MAG: hypothetical protein FJ027_21520 [Candidatus Rokubacteria bacterium]|nr:hypothetical protein [Candidatus Rokubacteria bacterium]
MATLILSRSDVCALLTLADCIAAVEQAFRAHAEQRTLGPDTQLTLRGGDRS